MTFVQQLMARLRGWGDEPDPFARIQVDPRREPTPLYGIRWENGDIELGYTRDLAVCMGGLRHDEVTTTTEWGQVTLMVSTDNGTTWKEATQ